MVLRVVLVDDHHLFRRGLRAALSACADFTVVGEAAEAREAYGVIEAQRPDLATVDISLPGTDGIAATREILRRAPRCRVMVLSMHAGREHAAQALAAGARGYALKEQPVDDVIDAIRAVGRGEVYLAPGLPESLRDQAAGDADPLGQLSPREREVFGLVVRGFSNQRIADELCISVKTVESHRMNINRKLDAHSTAELVRLAARLGLVTG